MVWSPPRDRVLLVKVTILVCDRCGKKLRGEEAREAKLDLSLKFDDPETTRLFPLRRRETIELCPSCREAFAEWLGDRGDAIPGLRTDAEPAPSSVGATPATATASQDTHA